MISRCSLCSLHTAFLLLLIKLTLFLVFHFDWKYSNLQIFINNDPKQHYTDIFAISKQAACEVNESNLWILCLFWQDVCAIWRLTSINYPSNMCVCLGNSWLTGHEQSSWAKILLYGNQSKPIGNKQQLLTIDFGGAWWH